MRNEWFMRAMVICAVSYPSVSRAVQYQITDLGSLGSGSSAAGLNNSGVVVGWTYTSSGPSHAFVYQGGTMTDLGTLGFPYSQASAINSSGDIVGYLSSSVTHAFLVHNGTMSDLGTLGGSSSAAYAINASGIIVGDSQTDGNAAGHAFVYDSTGMHDLGTLGGLNSFADAINSSGQIAGWADFSGSAPNHAFLYSNGTMNDLHTLGGSDSAAYAMNDAGDVVGFSDVASGDEHAFLYHNGVMTDLLTLGGSRSEAMAINSSGWVVGDSLLDGDNARDAFLYTGGTLMDLNGLAPGSNWALWHAYGINDLGQIVGDGLNPDGSFHAYLATPVPEPASAMILAPIGIMALRRQRRGV